MLYVQEAQVVMVEMHGVFKDTTKRGGAVSSIWSPRRDDDDGASGRNGQTMMPTMERGADLITRTSVLLSSDRGEKCASRDFGVTPILSIILARV